MYRVVLGNPTRLRYQWQRLVEEVFDLFLPVIRHPSCRFNRLRVNSTMDVPTLATHDLLIYIFASSACSPVAEHFQAQRGHSGTTAWGGGDTGSEVYLRGLEGPGHVARLVFHEAMHNKLHAGDSLHGGNGLAGDPIYADTALTSENIERMAPALSTNRRQWTGAWAMINDPLSPLLCS